MTPLRKRIITLASTVESARESATRLARGSLGPLTRAQMVARIRRLLTEAQEELSGIISTELSREEKHHE